MHKPKTLITGVSGFVGTKLARKLLTDDHEVIGVDLKPCKELEGIHGYQFQEVDLTSWKSVDQLKLSGLDHVVHLAAAGVKAAGRQWPICVRVNVEGTANLVKKLLSEVDSKLPASRRAAPLFLYTKTWYEDHLDECEAFATSPYVVTKAAATRWVETLSKTYSSPVVIAKVFQVYGPGDDPNNVLSYAARTLKSAEEPCFGSGKSERDWIYIDDFIDALSACLGYQTPSLHCVDLGTGEMTSLRKIIHIIASLCGRETKEEWFTADMDRGDVDLTDWAERPPKSWAPQYSLEEGLHVLLGEY